MHQKVNVLIFLKNVEREICPKRRILKEKKIKCDHSLVFSCLHLLFPRKIKIKIISNKLFYISLHGPVPFLLEPLFCLSHCKTCWTMSLDNIGFKCVFWGPWTPWSLWHFFLGVNRSGPKMNSTTNHKNYRALGRLHGSRCKQPLQHEQVS